MTGTTPTTDRIEDIVSAIKLFRKTAALARDSANGISGEFFPALRIKWLKQARRRDRAAERLIKLLGKECSRLVEAQR